MSNMQMKGSMEDKFSENDSRSVAEEFKIEEDLLSRIDEEGHIIENFSKNKFTVPQEFTC